MFQECPHCFNHVIPSSGVCPSCRGSMHTASTLTTITAHITNQFPDYCHRCCIPTLSSKNIVGYDSNHIPDPTHTREIPVGCLLRLACIPFIVVATLIFSILGLILSFLLTIVIMVIRATKQTKTHRSKVKIKLPTCKDCSKLALDARDVSWERGTMRIIVHPEFAKMVESRSGN